MSLCCTVRCSTNEPAYKRPTSARAPCQFERHVMPKPLMGAELEAGRVPEEDMLPLSVLTAQQVRSP